MTGPITLLACGTRGDIQPYLALGSGLQAHGWRIQIATYPNFRPLVEKSGLPFVPLDGNPSELMTHSGGQSALTFDGNWLRNAQATQRFLTNARPLYKRMLESAWKACQGSCAVIAGLPALWAVHIANALQIPCVWAFLQPVTHTRDFPSPVLPATFSLGPAYNRLSYRLVEQAAWQPWRGLVNHWRRESLGLPVAPVWGNYQQIFGSGSALLYGFSRYVVPPAADWPAHHHVTGYWFPPSDQAWCTSPSMEDFIGAGPQPVYIGFGSPGTRQPGQTFSLVLQALQETGLRAVVALPEDFSAGIHLPPTVHLASDAPHSWLFSRMQAVVHHGGAGTTASGLTAGKPTLIIPLAVDQFYWGQRVHALGVGPYALPQRSLTVSRLAQRLVELTSSKVINANARSLGNAIRSENGIETAVELIRSWVPPA